MKKIVSLFAFCLLVFTMQAQDRFSCSMEMVAGVGFARGPLATVFPQFVACYDFGNGPFLGIGAGMRFSAPCEKISCYPSAGRRFADEYDIPVFARFGYGIDRFYAAVDAGYAVGVFATLGDDYLPSGDIKPIYSGFFVDPHVGWKFGRHSALALGVLFQQCVIAEEIKIEQGTSVTYKTRSHKRFPPAVTLRYAFTF